MAYTLSGSISSQSKFLYQSSLDLNVTFSGSPQKDFTVTLSSTDITKLYFKRYTITSTPTVLDLTSGLTDAFGNAVVFSVVKHLQIVNNDVTNALTVGGGTTPVISALPALSGASGSCVNLTTPLAVDSTHKLLSLVAGAGSILVDVVIAGI